MLKMLRTEAQVRRSGSTAALFLLFGGGWFAAAAANTGLTLLLFGWLFAAILWGAFGVVRHAEHLAETARRALRHADPHPLGHHHRGGVHRHRDRDQHRQLAGRPRRGVRSGHDHAQRHDRALPAARRTAPPRAELQPARRARLPFGRDPARDLRTGAAELHRVAPGPVLSTPQAITIAVSDARALRRIPRHADRASPQLLPGPGRGRRQRHPGRADTATPARIRSHTTPRACCSRSRPRSI